MSAMGVLLTMEKRKSVLLKKMPVSILVLVSTLHIFRFVFVSSNTVFRCLWGNCY